MNTKRHEFEWSAGGSRAALRHAMKPTAMSGERAMTTLKTETKVRPTGRPTGLAPATVLALLLAGVGVWAQPAPATEPAVPPPAETPAAAPAAPAPAEAAAAEPALRRIDDAAPAPAPEEGKTERKSGRKTGTRRSGGEPPFGDHTVAAGGRAVEVVSIFGSSRAEGDVDRDIVSVLGNTFIGADAKVGGEAVAVLGTVTVEGSVRGEAVSVLGGVTVNGRVGGEVVSVLGPVQLGPQAVIEGDLVIVGGRLTRDPGATVRGNVVNVPVLGGLAGVEWLTTWFKRCVLLGRPLAFGENLGWAWLVALSLLGLYVLFALIFPRGIERCTTTFETRPGYSILTSFLTVFLSPVAMVLLVATVLGLLLVPFLGLALFAASLFGKAVMLAWFGRRIAGLAGGGPRHPAAAVLLGGAAVLLLYTIPVFGFLLYKLISWLGLGAVVYTVALGMKRESPAAASAAGGGAGPEGGPGSSGGGGAPAMPPAPVAAASAAVPPAGTPGIVAAMSAPAASATTVGPAVVAAPGATAEPVGTATGSGPTSAAEGFPAVGASGPAFEPTGLPPATPVPDAGAAVPPVWPASGPAGAASAGFAAGRASAGFGATASPASTAIPPQPPLRPAVGAEGVQVPAAAATTLPRAGFWIRLGAMAIDFLLLGVATGMLNGILPRALETEGPAVLLFLAVYGAVMWKHKGTTIGGVICGLKVVRLDDRPLDWATAWVRAASCFLSLLPAGLGFLWVLFDDDRQSWHDKIAGTTVVRVPKGVSLL